MNNFRYHVVSLTAVFLALAIGLIVGTAGLNGPAADLLHQQVNQLSKQNGQYRDQISQLQSEASKKEQFATEVAPALLQDKLSGRRVLVVNMPDSQQYVANVLTALDQAGAKVTAQVQIDDNFVLPDSGVALDDLTNSALNTVAVPPPTTNNGDAVETATALLVEVLMDRTTPIPATDRLSVLKAFINQKFIEVKDADGKAIDKNPGDTAEAVVFIARGPYLDSNASKENDNVVTVISQLQTGGPIVVAAAGAAGSGNVISAVRGDAAQNKLISTVDNVNTPEGQIATALALNEQIVYKRAGAYGSGSGADSYVPKLPE